VDKFGITRFNSYGSATVDGVVLLLDCGLEPTHPRVEAAKDWFRKNYDVKHNPGKFVAGNEDLRDATYFYYCRGLARMMQRMAWRQWLVKDKSIDVAMALAEELISRQRDDGSWTNRFTDGREDDPLVATPLAAEALLICRQIINAPAKPTTAPATTQSIAHVRPSPALVSSPDAIRSRPAFADADRARVAAGDRGDRDGFLSLQRGRRTRRANRVRRARAISHRRLRAGWAGDSDGDRGRQLGRCLPPGRGEGH
jgi:hypothetical protein